MLTEERVLRAMKTPPWTGFYGTSLGDGGEQKGAPHPCQQQMTRAVCVRGKARPCFLLP